MIEDTISYDEALSSPTHNEWMSAMWNELESITANQFEN